MNIYAVGASFLGTGVEFVEALTIILAVGTIRGWKSALVGAVSAVILLVALVAVIGAPLSYIVRLEWVQLVVGFVMLLFGIRWLRKAILRYAGLKAVHDETESYQKEVERQRRAGHVTSSLDKFAITTTFTGTFLEGLEAIFIVITFGFSSHDMPSAISGAVIATVVVTGLGIGLRAPLSKIPENTMKFIVGVMLTSFGAFWVGESLSVHWPEGDVSILYLAITLCALAWLLVARCRNRLQRFQQADSAHSTIGVN